MREVTIMRGLPGSGKSYHARFYGVMVCSADDYFTTQDGAHHFNPADISKAHQACFRRFLTLLRDGATNIVVDNTNLSAWEISPYVLAAESHGYTARIVSVACDAAKAFARQRHSVPEATHKRMAEAFARHDLLPWWHHETVSGEK